MCILIKKYMCINIRVCIYLVLNELRLEFRVLDATHHLYLPTYLSIHTHIYSYLYSYTYLPIHTHIYTYTHTYPSPLPDVPLALLGIPDARRHSPAYPRGLWCWAEPPPSNPHSGGLRGWRCGRRWDGRPHCRGERWGSGEGKKRKKY
jgi:hypothetical protein